MPVLTFMRVLDGIYPADDETAEYVHKLKPGDRITGDFKKQRNPAFHRKLFALFKFLFEQWEPAEFNQRQLAEAAVAPELKSFDRFRKDLTILAGFYEQTVRLNGEVRTEAKSLAVGSMDADEFEELYNAVITAGMKYVLVPGYTRDQVDHAVEELLMGFA